jgi:hypothetical protein
MQLNTERFLILSLLRYAIITQMPSVQHVPPVEECCRNSDTGQVLEVLRVQNVLRRGNQCEYNVKWMKLQNIREGSDYRAYLFAFLPPPPPSDDMFW